MENLDHRTVRVLDSMENVRSVEGVVEESEELFKGYFRHFPWDKLPLTLLDRRRLRQRTLGPQVVPRWGSCTVST